MYIYLYTTCNLILNKLIVLSYLKSAFFHYYCLFFYLKIKSFYFSLAWIIKNCIILDQILILNYQDRFKLQKSYVNIFCSFEIIYIKLYTFYFIPTITLKI